MQNVSLHSPIIKQVLFETCIFQLYMLPEHPRLYDTRTNKDGWLYFLVQGQWKL